MVVGKTLQRENVQDVPKPAKIKFVDFGPSFGCFLPSDDPSTQKNTLLNILNVLFIISYLGLIKRIFEKSAIWPKTPDFGGYDPSQNIFHLVSMFTLSFDCG